MLRRHFFFLAFLLVVFSIGAGAAQKKNKGDYWKETRLSMADLATMMRTENCYKAPSWFSACVGAMDILLRGTQPHGSFVEWPAAGSNWKLIQSFGPIAAAQDTSEKDSVAEAPAETSFRQTWLKLQAEKKKREDSLQALFNQTSDAPIDFKAILEYLSGTLQSRADQNLLISQAINSFLIAAVDPHTHIDPAQEINEEMNSESEQYFGIGVMLQHVAGRVVIQAPMDGSPALQAGVHANDVLLEIDGKPLTGLNFEEITQKVRGPAGTKVRLTLQRKGKTLQLDVLRAPIEQPNVTFKLLRDEKMPIGYIRLTSFMSQTGCQQITSAVRSLQKQGAQALILDLRNNPGGLLTQAVCIGGLFAGKKVIVQVKDLNSNRFSPQSAAASAITSLPMVTLINSNSASASEILAGALQDYQRSWIAGERSFGKATVQAPQYFTPDGQKVFNDILIYRTIQRFYQPSGRTNQQVGISPDLPIDIKPDATEDDRFALREADIYNNALPPVGAAWTQPRPQQVARLQACAAREGNAAQLYATRQDEAIPPDYQVLVAEDLLSCAISLALP